MFNHLLILKPRSIFWIQKGFFLCFFGCSLCFPFLSYAKLTYTLEYTTEELQEKITPLFPYTIQRPFITLLLSNPVISLKEGQDHIGFKITLQLQFRNVTSPNGIMEITGKLRYEATQGALFLDETQIQSLEIQGISPPILSQITQLLNAPQFQEHLSKRPIFSLKEDNTKHQLAKLFLKAVLVKNGKLILELELL